MLFFMTVTLPVTLPLTQQVLGHSHRSRTDHPEGFCIDGENVCASMTDNRSAPFALRPVCSVAKNARLIQGQSYSLRSSGAYAREADRMYHVRRRQSLAAGWTEAHYVRVGCRSLFDVYSRKM